MRFVFGVTALLCFITSVMAGLIHEEPVQVCSSRIGLWDPESKETDETR
jgi:hypothetical protein